jgi:ADP-ribosylation factor-like protein 5B
VSASADGIPAAHVPTPLPNRGGRLALGEVIESSPTVGSNVEEVAHRNVRFQVWDLGGQDKLRKVWATYYVGATAVVLVVDSMDRTRLPTLKQELDALVGSEALAGAVLLVFANKQDLAGAMTAVEITESLQLHGIKDHGWQIQACSATTGEGLYEGLDWLTHALKNPART